MPRPDRVRPRYREEFADLGEFVRAIVSAADPLNPRDERLEFSGAATGMNEATPAEGGWLVPDDLAELLWEGVFGLGQIISRCDRMPVTRGAGLKIPAVDETSRADGSRFGGVRAYWADEATAAAATKPKGRQIELKPKKLVATCFATGELMEDAAAVAAWVRRAFMAEATFTIEDAIINGDGVGKPLGVLNSGAVISVAAESGQASSTVVPANLKKMAARLWGPSHQSAAWLMSNDVFAQVCDASFSNGSPVVTTGPDGGRAILQMPIMLSEYSPSLGGLGDVTLADFSQFLVGEKAPEFLSSLHVRFLTHELAFRFRWRLDGQPAWRSPITPKNSANLELPFVSLAARP